MSTSPKILVDLDLCEANGLCQLAAPEVFRVEEDDTLTVIHEHPPAELERKVAKALARCPRGALSRA